MKPGDLVIFSKKLLEYYKLSPDNIFIMYDYHDHVIEKCIVEGNEILFVLECYMNKEIPRQYHSIRVLKNNLEDGWITPKLFVVII